MAASQINSNAEFERQSPPKFELNEKKEIHAQMDLRSFASVFSAWARILFFGVIADKKKKVSFYFEPRVMRRKLKTRKYSDAAQRINSPLDDVTHICMTV